ncbi:MAG: hypothetical protein JWM68_3649 [Verrucomicrobiales bacterium]|nr:hypothetical protein [Verrucomicrobiales bacterium]
MTVVRSLLICVCAFLFHLPLQAEPLNVLVGEITFSRPEEWKWELPVSKTTALVRFVIPSPPGRPALTDVRFFLGTKNPAAAAALWKSYFPETKEGGDIHEEKAQIAGYNFTYLTLHGTYVFPGSKGKRDQTLIGIVIPSGKQYVQVRLLGPTDEVKAATGRFRKMIENALREKAAE